MSIQSFCFSAKTEEERKAIPVNPLNILINFILSKLDYDEKKINVDLNELIKL